MKKDLQEIFYPRPQTFETWNVCSGYKARNKKVPDYYIRGVEKLPVVC